VPHRPTSRPLRWLTRVTTGVTSAGLLLLGAPVVVGMTGPPSGSEHGSAPGRAPVTTTDVPLATGELELVSHRKAHPHRKIKKYRVRAGDTPSAIATRYHAWTDELIAMNHGSVLYVGEVVRIPVVVKAARACTKHRHHHTHFRSRHEHQHGAGPQKDKPKKQHGAKADKPKKKHHSKPPKKKPSKKPHKHRHGHRHAAHGWVHAGASRAEVRRAVIRVAKRHGVNPDLALAIAWQESGWQQKQISYAGALGVMQVMPGTGTWMSQTVGRKLNLRNLHHNVTAGVVLIKILRQQAGPRYAIAGYYQGLAGVRRYGMYESTKHYVANVLALKKKVARGWNPA
jgi:LysM repeat protein